MTYSEVVLVLSSHMVPKDDLNPQQSVPLLEKFIQGENAEEPSADLLPETNADGGLSGYGGGEMQIAGPEDSAYTREYVEEEPTNQMEDDDVEDEELDREQEV